MNPNTSKVSTKKVAESAMSLEPSAIVTLFEIDVSDLIARGERHVYSDIGEPIRSQLRFHNNLKLIQNNIIWNGNDYFPVPIKADGFETSAKGSPPTPKLTLTINPKGLDEETQHRIKYIKYAIRDLDSLVGAKVTRTRTFAKYLDGLNFYDNYGVVTGPEEDQQKLKSNILQPPEGFDPDPNAYFPQDVYFIDRKSGENKNTVEFELASPFDLQGLKLPARVVTEHNCVWTYRGEGCCYEYDTVKQTGVTDIHYNEDGNCRAPEGGSAPPLATFKNEKISKIIGTSLKHSASSGYVPGELWDQSKTYSAGQYVRVNLKGVNYYYVSRGQVNNVDNLGKPPPHEAFWVADECSKELKGCALRWRENPESAQPATTPLPIGAFPTSRRGGTS
jgi:phage-related protein